MRRCPRHNYTALPRFRGQMKSSFVSGKLAENGRWIESCRRAGINKVRLKAVEVRVLEGRCDAEEKEWLLTRDVLFGVWISARTWC